MRFYDLIAFANLALAACNGHDELCDLKYSEVTFIGAHNSAFDGNLPVPQSVRLCDAATRSRSAVLASADSREGW